MNSQSPKRNQIGRYTLIRLLARGGMAEVFLGRAEGPRGFSKEVVIKRILPDLAFEPRFLEMFLDEAKLVACLNHPNIAQVFDFGEDDGEHFIAMEYVEGQSVRSIENYLSAQKRPCPISIAISIGLGICEGLSYAHCLKDKDGTPYNIIHRDISPDNLLISTSGMPKIVDFGVAKATSHIYKTEAGTIKGKYPYMPPEQIRGEQVSQQCDLYSLGVVLFELIAGRKPFRGDSGVELIHKVLNEQTPLLTDVRPDVPKKLADIVFKAMSKETAERFQDANSFKLALEEFANSCKIRPDVKAVANLVSQVAAARQDRVLHCVGTAISGSSNVASKAASHSLTGFKDLPSSSSKSARAAETGKYSTDNSKNGENDNGSISSFEKSRFQPFWKTRSFKRASIILAAAACVTSIAWAGMARVSSKKTAVKSVGSQIALPIAAPDSFEKKESVNQVDASFLNNDLSIADEAEQRSISQSAAKANVANTEGRKIVTNSRSRATLGRTAPGSSERSMSGKDQPDGYLSVVSEPWCNVYVDGEKIGTTPLFRTPIPSGKHEILLLNDKLGKMRREIINIRPTLETRKSIILD